MIAIVVAGIFAGIGIGLIFSKCEVGGAFTGFGISCFIIGFFSLKNYVRLDKSDKEIEFHNMLKENRTSIKLNLTISLTDIKYHRRGNREHKRGKKLNSRKS
jgi:uncharacterized membrane-anchored protein YitT (DUF2179 family)